MLWFEFFLVIGIIAYVFHKILTKTQKHWSSRGVKPLSFTSIVKDALKPILQKEDPILYQMDFYNRGRNKRCFGVYFFSNPFFMVRDPDILKLIMVKDSNNFRNRYNWNQNSDPFIAKNLSLLQGEKWRNLRMVMTTVFTAAKMKDMFGFMKTCSEQANDWLTEKIEEQIGETGSNVYEVEIKELFSKLGTDIIASTAFGLEVNSLKNPKNEFYSIGMKMRENFTSFTVLKMILMSSFPSVSKALNLSLFDRKITEFFTSIVTETIQNREKNKIVRKDLIHILTEARKNGIQNGEKEIAKGKLPYLTDEDIASQSWSFFFGGFDIMATCLGFLCHELAVNPDLQEKLYEEIKQIAERDGTIGYNQVMYDMQYLDMVVKESFRKWPPVGTTDREVTEDYVIPESENEPALTFKEGDVIIIPILGLHRDPDLFPDPEKFDPERFRDEKNTLKPFTYLPFGAGIRHCIAMRYVTMEIKQCLVFLLTKFQILTTAKTDVPLKLSKKNGFMLQVDNGIWLGLKPRV